MPYLVRFVGVGIILFGLLRCASSVSSTSSEQRKITPERDSIQIGVGVGAELLPTPESDNEDAIGEIPPREKVPVLSAVERSPLDEWYTYYQVRFSDTTGWVLGNHIPSSEEYKENKRLVDKLKRKGYTVVPVFQTFGKNSADGVTLRFGVANISSTKTVKYVRSTWKLFNSVGDPVKGDNSGESIARAKLTGPLSPREAATAKFENVWYSSTATCAELRGLQVEFIDGTTFSTTDFSLFKEVSRIDQISQEITSELSTSEILSLAGNLVESSDVDIGFRTDGDCSYEAQQQRKNSK
jgi:hypothetical protein